METKIRVGLNNFGEWVVDTDALYVEDVQAEPTSRLTESDVYDIEYVGYGHIGELPVQAIYLFASSVVDDDPGSWNWDLALDRIIIDLDKINDRQLAELRNAIKN